MTLTNEKENVVKASVVMTPGYNSSVRIIGVASNTVIPTATQEAPLSKTSAFVLPETVMQTAEKVLGTTDVSSIPQQQYVTNILPQPVSQLQQADAAINNVQQQVPSMETIPVQVNNPQSLNSLVGSSAIQFENAPTDNVAHPVQQQVNSQAYTVPIEQTLNTNLSQQQFAPSEEITSNSEFETQTDNDVDQVTTLNEPPVLPAFDDNVSSNLKQSSGYKYELISILKKYLKSSIERYELQAKTQSEILNELEKYEEKLTSEKHDNSQEMTTNYVTEPSFNTNFNNTYDEQGVSSGLHM